MPWWLWLVLSWLVVTPLIVGFLCVAHVDDAEEDSPLASDTKDRR